VKFFAVCSVIFVCDDDTTKNEIWDLPDCHGHYICQLRMYWLNNSKEKKLLQV
jgi:hypothetical protein